MTRVMMLGDTHGDPEFVHNALRYASSKEVDAIVQLGDFGYTFHPRFIKSILEWLDMDDEREFFWLDGNHDHHDYIEQTILKNGGVSKSHPISHFHQRMYYCPRGSVATIGDKKCLFMGGAYSIDKRYRVPYVSWWPQEMIRYSDIDNALRNVTEYDGVDVLFSHDCPEHELLRQWLYSKGYKVDDQSSQNREALTVLLDRVRPTEMYHGHFHYRYTYVDTELSPGWEYTIHGVAANMDQMGFDHSTKAIPDGNCVIRDW